jgi:predicted enzyme related to lactoylglutathione lyase
VGGDQRTYGFVSYTVLLAGDEDCTGAAQRAEELGGLVAEPPTPVGDGHFAVIADPQGATFQLMDHTP